MTKIRWAGLALLFAWGCGDGDDVAGSGGRDSVVTGGSDGSGGSAGGDGSGGRSDGSGGDAGGAASGGHSGGAASGGDAGGGPSGGGDPDGGAGGAASGGGQSSARELGDGCTGAGQCESGHCVDGVCCESACDELCTACTEAATGEANGQCATVTAGEDPDDECAESACGTGACDGAGACDAAPEETPCRASAGPCDPVELCDGVSLECPGDDVSAAGTTCRDAESACDVEEVCDGDSVACPSDVVLGAGNYCGGYECVDGSGACPTSCSVDADCAAAHVCVSGSCVPGRRAFITSTTWTGALGGLDGGDSYCQTLASAAYREGTYRMWLSDATGSPSTRFVQSDVPYYRFDGVAIAMSYEDLTDGTLLAPLEVTQHGATVSSNVPFTGTNADGTARQTSSAAEDNCSGWTSSATTQHAWAGQSEGTDATWTASSNSGAPRQCNVAHRFYCFEQ